MAYMRYLILKGTYFKTPLQQFEELNERMNKAFGYPSSDAVRYASPELFHVGTSHIAFPLEPRCTQHLTIEEATQLVGRESLTGWFEDNRIGATPDYRTKLGALLRPKDHQSIGHAFDTEFWLRAGAATAALGTIAGFAHYVWHWF